MMEKVLLLSLGYVAVWLLIMAVGVSFVVKNENIPLFLTTSMIIAALPTGMLNTGRASA